MRSRLLVIVYLVAAVVGLAGAGMPASEARNHIEHRSAPATDILPGDSLYQLPVTLQTAEGRTLKLGDLRGLPLVVTLFYSQCSSVCPLLTSQVQRVIGALSPTERRQIRILMVSFDSLRDTPEVLTAFKAEHHSQDENWIIAHASAGDVRALAAALGIRYRELPDHTFNHSAIISVADRDGTLRARSSEITGLDKEFIAAVRAQIAVAPTTGSGSATRPADE
jgi:protein SCO1